MKAMISVDIEGIAHWDEALKSDPGHAPFRDLMTDEAIATCRGAQAEGAAAIVQRDAHENSRNLDFSRLPDGLQAIRGWSGHPYKMVQDLEDSFDALVMVGWHEPVGNGGNPLSHAMTGRYAHITLNGALLSEFPYVRGIVAQL
jgi:D-amino peptidase